MQVFIIQILSCIKVSLFCASLICFRWLAARVHFQMDTGKSVQTLLNRITTRSSNTFSIIFFVKKHRVSNDEVPI